MDMQTLEQESAGELSLEQLQAIDTGWGPKAESALLLDLLKRNLGVTQSPADATEVRNDCNPSARLNAYKHRFQALRGEYVEARLRGIELEDQLAETNLRILRLEARVKHLDTTLEQIYATRLWKVRKRCARCWRAVSQWLSSRGRSQAEAAPLSNDRGSDG